jgi:ankyrin repeat protein
MLACTKQDDVIVKFLIDHGASPVLRNKDGWNSFHLACREGNASIVSYLLSNDPTLLQSKSKNGRTPLHTAGRNLRGVLLLALANDISHLMQQRFTEIWMLSIC